jgi:HK97 gp10 family phage protein
MEIEHKITGLDDFDRRVKSLSVETTGKAMRSAVVAAVKPMVDDAKSLVRKNSYRTGLLEAALRRRSFIGPAAAPYTVAAGLDIRRGRRYGGSNWHLIEFGTADRVGKDGHRTGKVHPEPFVRPSFRRNTRKMLDIMTRRLLQKIDKAIRS